MTGPALVNKVHVYRRIIPDLDDYKLFRMCVQSWERAGWEVVATGPEDAHNSPLFPAVAANKHNLLGGFSDGRRDWGFASFEKWLAAEFVSRDEPAFLATDLDVINYGWTPAMCAEAARKCRRANGHGIIVFSHATADVDGSRVVPPTPVLAWHHSAHLLFQAFAGYSDAHRASRRGQESAVGSWRHRAGEMPGLNNAWRLHWVEWPVARIYGDAGWESAPLVHYMHRACAGDFTTNRGLFVLEKRSP